MCGELPGRGADRYDPSTTHLRRPPDVHHPCAGSSCPRRMSAMELSGRDDGSATAAKIASFFRPSSNQAPLFAARADRSSVSIIMACLALWTSMVWAHRGCMHTPARFRAELPRRAPDALPSPRPPRACRRAGLWSGRAIPTWARKAEARQDLLERAPRARPPLAFLEAERSDHPLRLSHLYFRSLGYRSGRARRTAHYHRARRRCRGFKSAWPLRPLLDTQGRLALNSPISTSAG